MRWAFRRMNTSSMNAFSAAAGAQQTGMMPPGSLPVPPGRVSEQSPLPAAGGSTGGGTRSAGPEDDEASGRGGFGWPSAPGAAASPVGVGPGGSPPASVTGPSQASAPTASSDATTSR